MMGGLCCGYGTKSTRTVTMMLLVTHLVMITSSVAKPIAGLPYRARSGTYHVSLLGSADRVKRWSNGQDVPADKQVPLGRVSTCDSRTQFCDDVVNSCGSCEDDVCNPRRYGFEGAKEDCQHYCPVPEVVAEDFAIDEDTLNATSAVFTWTPVDDNPDLIKGDFKGYLIKFWKSNEGQDKAREHLVPVGKYDPCPDAGRPSRPHSRSKRQAEVDSGHVMNLWPYSELTAGVLVVNGGKSGEMSDTITFQTPEGVPGMVGDIEITETGSHHLKVEWTKPLEPNGILVGYTIGYQRAARPRGIEKQYINDPNLLYGKIKELDETTDYIVYVWARTVTGEGVPDRAEGRTLAAGEFWKTQQERIKAASLTTTSTLAKTTENGDVGIRRSQTAPSLDQSVANKQAYFYLMFFLVLTLALGVIVVALSVIAVTLLKRQWKSQKVSSNKVNILIGLMIVLIVMIASLRGHANDVVEDGSPYGENGNQPSQDEIPRGGCVDSEAVQNSPVLFQTAKLEGDTRSSFHQPIQAASWNTGYC